MSDPHARRAAITEAVKAVIKKLSGRDLTPADFAATFFDLGFDSLLLTQASQSLRSTFGVKITFRQLMETLVTINAVTNYLDEHVPADQFTVPVPPAATPAPLPAPKRLAEKPAMAPATSSPFAAAANGDGLIDRVVKQQLVLMNQQLDLLRGHGQLSDDTSPGQEVSPPPASAPAEKKPAPAPAPDGAPRYFGPYKPMDRSPTGGLTDLQQEHLANLIQAYVERTPRSKAYTARQRGHFADPRTVSGYRQNWKEMVYPIVVKHSSGSRFWDIDNNEYLDLTMGFGTNLFGHSPDFVTRALKNQLRHGVEVGPQSPIAGKVASLLCELSGMERAAFAGSGSEAVLAAVRLARTVSGRTKIATTSGYHGINDEVLVRASVIDGVRHPAPIAPGIPQHLVDEVLVLDYGTDESLELLRAHAHELAAVLIEPVQSRRPDLQPVEFLREVRRITAESGTALIFDELITGFRTHPGGAQKFWGIEADLATYGKVMGGGLPIGAICGKAKYLDALDGGNWAYGDDSSPEVGMTFFAGTYVRHPLAVRAALSVLTLLKREGPALQDKLSETTAWLAGELNAYFDAEQIPMRVTFFRSMMYFVFQQEFRYSSLLFFHLRLKGLHIWEGRPCFLSTAHTREEINFIISVFKESLEEMRTGEFLPRPEAAEEASLPLPPITASSIDASEKPTTPRAMEYSLYFFGNYTAAYREDKYSLLQEAAKFGDQNGFTAVWLPERHFHAVGGFSPNSSLLACALAGQTRNLQLRGGSVVLPLHHPIRVAEEWSVADNLSQGRVAISIATGWHPNDFVFAPEAFEKRRDICLQNLETIQKLWRGETVPMPTPGGENLPVRLHPLPMQPELPIWLTCIHRDSYADAGRRGLNVLGYLMNQTVDELAEKIAAYREGRRAAGLDPATGHVTTLLFTYLDDTDEKAREVARGPLCRYLRSYLDNSQKKIERQIGEVEVDEEDIDYLTNRSCDDYFNGKSLIGTVASCATLVNRLKAIGVDEIGCFVDFGVESAPVLQSLELVTALMQPTGTDQTLPLTEAEQGLWLLSSLNPDAARAYRESVTLRLTGELDRDILLQAIQAVVDRHGALRTVIASDGQSQTVRARQIFELDYVDYSDLPPEEARAEAETMLLSLEDGSFDRMSGPFLAGCLLKIGADRHLLTFFFHHVVGNGPSYWVFLEELAALYEAYTTDRPEELPAPFPFHEFIEQKQAYESSREKDEAEIFWRKQMAGGIPVLDLPTDQPPPPELTYVGSREEIVLDPALTDALKKVGAARRCSLFMVLLSAYSVLLHRLSGQDDLILGVPFDSPIRSENADRNLFANTTNMLPLRSELAEGSSFAVYLSLMKEVVLASSEHQDYFFGNLIGKLSLPRDPSRAPFFNVVFNLETGEFHRRFARLELALETRNVPYRAPRNAAMFDLYLNAAEKKNGEILVQCDYNTALITPETMRRWLGHFHAILRGIVADPEQLVIDLPLTGPETSAELLVSA